jgi:hypothetical protein
MGVEVWMMTSKLFDQTYGTAVFRNRGYPDRCMGQTLFKVSMFLRTTVENQCLILIHNSSVLHVHPSLDLTSKSGFANFENDKG